MPADAPSDDRFIQGYPNPLLSAYIEAERAYKNREAPMDAALKMCGACESSASYLASVLLAQYVDLSLMDEGVEREIAGLRPGEMSFGSWLSVLKALVAAVPKSVPREKEVVPSHLGLTKDNSRECEAAHGRVLEWIDRIKGTPAERTFNRKAPALCFLDAMNQLRNRVHHADQDKAGGLTPQDWERFDFDGVWEGVVGWMRALTFLDRCTLVRIDDVRPAKGKMGHSCAHLHGGVARAADLYLSDASHQLSKGRLYLFHGSPPQPLLCLYPLLACDGDRVAFLPRSAAQDVRALEDRRTRWRINQSVSEEALAKYREAVSNARRDGTVSDTERRTLEILRDTLGIPEPVAEQIHSEGAPSTATTGAAPTDQLRLVKTRALGSAARRMIYLERSRRFLLGLEDGRVLLVGADDDRPRVEFRVEGVPRCVDASSSGDRVVVGTWTGGLAMADSEGILWEKSLGSIPEAVFASPDGARTLVVTWAGRVLVLDGSGQTVADRDLGAHAICAAAHESREHVAVATDAPDLCWIGADGTLAVRAPLPDLPAGIALPRQAEEAWVGCQDGSVVSVAASGVTNPLHRDAQPVRGLWCAEDGETLLVQFGPRTLFLYSPKRGVRWTHEVDADVRTACVAEGGGPAVAVIDGPALVLLDRRRQAHRIPLPALPCSIAVDPGARVLHLAQSDGALVTWLNRAALAASTGPRIRVTARCAKGLRRDLVNTLELEIENRGDQAAKSVVVQLRGRNLREEQEDRVGDLRAGERRTRQIPLEIDTHGTPPVLFEVAYFPEFEEASRLLERRELLPVADVKGGEAPEPFERVVLSEGE